MRSFPDSSGDTSRRELQQAGGPAELLGLVFDRVLWAAARRRGLSLFDVDASFRKGTPKGRALPERERVVRVWPWVAVAAHKYKKTLHASQHGVNLKPADAKRAFKGIGTHAASLRAQLGIVAVAGALGGGAGSREIASGVSALAQAIVLDDEATVSPSIRNVVEGLSLHEFMVALDNLMIAAAVAEKMISAGTATRGPSLAGLPDYAATLGAVWKFATDRPPSTSPRITKEAETPSDYVTFCTSISEAAGIKQTPTAAMLRSALAV